MANINIHKYLFLHNYSINDLSFNKLTFSHAIACILFLFNNLLTYQKYVLITYHVPGTVLQCRV